MKMKCQLIIFLRKANLKDRNFMINPKNKRYPSICISRDKKKNSANRLGISEIASLKASFLVFFSERGMREKGSCYPFMCDK